MTPCVRCTNTPKANGYGYVWDGTKQVLEHRKVYEALHGPLLQGYQVDHLCRNRWCVNVTHLEAVTQQENIRRQFMAKYGYDPDTHCAAGHLRTEENTARASDGARRCRECSRAWDNRPENRARHNERRRERRRLATRRRR